MKEKLKALVDQALPEILKSLGFSDLEPHAIRYEINLPKIKAHGDLSINLAFHLSRVRKKNPIEVATTCQKILQKMVRGEKSLQAWVREITVEKPGFINFKLT
ncbi:MAG: hypothetical protein HY351_02915, partial [Candidatus Omnitrophica bacterium]|nr:hypothetical protein [Candidatus Omnitrophota bacterium]